LQLTFVGVIHFTSNCISLVHYKNYYYRSFLQKIQTGKDSLSNGQAGSKKKEKTLKSHKGDLIFLSGHAPNSVM